MKPSPSRLEHLEQLRAGNRLIHERIARQPGWSYVDVFTPMLTEAGEPREELFRSDLMHLNDNGYRLWASSLKPVLDEVVSPPKQSARARR